jgi:predicted dinucleotide-binding enzyme
MTTAIIGIGHIGSTLAQELASGNERVVLANRDPSKATALAKRLGPLATASTVEDAIAAADVVIFAVSFDVMKKMVPQFSSLLKGKIVVDPSNPVALDEKGRLKRILPEGQSAGSVIAGLLPAGARFVKAFGTLSAESLATQTRRVGNRAVLFYAADDPGAGELIRRLIRSAGFDPVRVGGVTESLRIEVGGDLHQIGGLNAKVLSVAEVLAALRTAAKETFPRSRPRPSEHHAPVQAPHRGD